jgi:hypothetical protein
MHSSAFGNIVEFTISALSGRTGTVECSAMFDGIISFSASTAFLVSQSAINSASIADSSKVSVSSILLHELIVLCSLMELHHISLRFHLQPVLISVLQTICCHIYLFKFIEFY